MFTESTGVHTALTASENFTLGFSCGSVPAFLLKNLSIKLSAITVAVIQHLRC